MLRVKTKLGPSTVHGIGLFADQSIPQGTITWQYDAEFDIGYTEEQAQRMPEHARKLLFWYAYYDKDSHKYILPSDDQRFINHSFQKANIQSTPDQDVAMRDIQVGEELLCNYNDFDDTYFKRMGYEDSALREPQAQI